MIVDDSLLIRAVVRAGLEAEGHQVMQAESGMAALEQCQIRPPDVILLDIIMPDLDGYQVLAKLKGDPKLSHIPVVFLTGRTDMSDVVAGLRAGAHDYLKKPFEPEELLARVGSAIHVKQLQDQLRERNAELDQVSRTDALTGLYNRRHLDEELIQRHSEARRYGEPLSLLLLDIDHFKRVNDTYGHPAGDIVLREFAAKLRTQLRVGDIAGRWGGEEFLIILPHTDLAGAATLAERIRAATAEAPITVATTPISVTVSGGCCAGPGGTPAELVDQADTQLYQAKAAGRNRIAVAEYRRPGDDVVTQSAANSARDIDRTAC
jgi:diguanylate cyclase (GGDEF)-like protein